MAAHTSRAHRRAPWTPHATPQAAWRRLRCGGCASPAPHVHLACTVKRAAESTSRAMCAAAGQCVVIQAVGARQRASCAPQRAAPPRCAANSQPVQMPPQRAAGASDSRSARVCAPIGAARELRASSALWTRRRPREPVSPGRADEAGARSSARARGVSRLQLRRLARWDRQCAARRSWPPGMRIKRNAGGADMRVKHLS